MDLEVKFANPQQREFYYSTARNQCFSGGFNNGKSYVGCLKAVTLLSTFSNCRGAIARQVRADLMKTTFQTFFKIMPQEFIESQNLQEGYTTFKNKSKIYWLHLKDVDESTLRGLELNFVLGDQAEEFEEKTYDVLDARIGRWDDAIVPEYLLRSNPNWPKNPLTGKYIVPSYNMLLCNPDTQFHFIYRKFHPDSPERDPDNFFIEGEWDSTLGSSETYKKALQHDDEWVAKYVKGQWGISSAQIHRVWHESYLDYSPELMDNIRRRGNLYRILDHGDASPTCCLWVAVLDGVYIFYREYYAPNKVISEHRKAINELSGGEYYNANYADPSIFHKSSQKNGGFWTIADEYSTSDLNSPPLFWQAADNNEFATRNRINELLRPSEKFRNPVTGLYGAPGIFFLRKSPEWEFGVSHGIKEISSQRRELIGYIDGRAIYSDNREPSVADHSYDCIRYFIAMHGSGTTATKRKVPQHSFKWYQAMMKKQVEAKAVIH